MARYDEIFSQNWGLFTHLTFSEVLHHVHIAWRSKIIYVETPKAVISTMKKLLIQNEWDAYADLDFDSIHDRRFSPLLNILQVPSFQDLLKDPAFIKICIVRDPVSRLLSAYLDQIQRGKDPDRMANITPFLEGHRHDVWADISFKRFVEAVCRQPVSLMDMHWRIQYHQVMMQHIPYDYVGKIEHIEGAINFMEANRPGIARYYDNNSPHATDAAKKKTEYYTEDLLEMVYDKFDIDFSTFHYPKECHSAF